MATLLNLKRRIKTTGNVSKTTKALQMISASKLKKAEDSALSSKPYVEKLYHLTKSLELKIDTEDKHEYMRLKSSVNGKLYIVVSPDKGLCGGLITNLMREVTNLNGQGKMYFVAIGKKAERIISSMGKDLIASFPFGTTLPEFDIVYPVAKIIDEYFMSGKASDVFIISTKFKGVFSQIPENISLLPVKFPEDANENNSPAIFEPNVANLLPDLLKHYIEMVIFQNLIESYASEQAARMMAMKNATDNALDIVSELQLEYNKTRQEKITNELLDIGSVSQINYE